VLRGRRLECAVLSFDLRITESTGGGLVAERFRSRFGLTVAASIAAAVLLAGSLSMLPLLGSAPASASGSAYSVQVGYADDFRPNPTNFPVPFGGDPTVIYEGCSPVSSCSFDAGAARVVNNTASVLTVDSVVIHFDTCVFDMWPHSVSIPAGDSLVVTQTASGVSNGCTPGTITGPDTMDSSDIGMGGAFWAFHCSQSGLIPEVDVTVGGVTRAFSDTGQILNTGGVDAAACPTPVVPGSPGNESIPWTPIGGCIPGSDTLTLTPPTQTLTVAGTATVQANLANSCGSLSGASVSFSVLSGPNTGGSGSATTDANGNASFSYPGTTAGTDTVQASVTTLAGPLDSNNVSVVWTLAPTSLTTSLSGGGTSGTQISVLVGTQVTDAATLSGAEAAIATGTVTYTVYSDARCQNAVASGGTKTVTAGSVPNSDPVTLNTPGTFYWRASYSGDTTRNAPSRSTCGAEVETVFSARAAGAFVIGDESAGTLAPGTKVNFWNFWGSQWSINNVLSGGTAPASFKGFTDHPARPTCGVNWSTRPGNSSSPPGTLPSQILVIVTSSAAKSGSTISGNTVHVVLVNVGPGYGPAPGQPGNGTIASVVC
jgi:hypothetical protein